MEYPMEVVMLAGISLSLLTIGILFAFWLEQFCKKCRWGKRETEGEAGKRGLCYFCYVREMALEELKKHRRKCV